MCGRISTADLDVEQLRERFHLAAVADFEQSYNLAPTAHIPVIRHEDHVRTLEPLRWGLIPHWSRDKNLQTLAFNARLETLSQKPFFRTSFRSKRCLVPVSGFYEWQQLEEKKQPYYAHRTDGQPLALAGLWDRWIDPDSGKAVDSCALITTAAAHSMASIHERMPVILEPEYIETWLDPEYVETNVLHDLLQSPAAEVLTLYPVSTYVSNARHDGVKCIEPVER